jgi:hypothetical protein
MCRLRALTQLNIPSMGGRTVYENVHGWTPDITPFIQMEWYEWVYYLDGEGDHQLARWLIPAESSRGGDCYWVLPLSCKPIVRSTVWSIPEDEKKHREMIEKMKVLRDQTPTLSQRGTENRQRNEN